MANRVTQAIAEAVASPTSQKARTTQAVVEAAVFPTGQQARLTQSAVEAVLGALRARLTQVAVEAVLLNAVYTRQDDTRIGVAGTGSCKFRIEIATDTEFANIVFSTDTVTNSFRLSDSDFFDARWLRVTPYDELGDGVGMTIQHSYTADVVDAVDPVSIDPPPTAEDTTTAPQTVIDNGYLAEFLEWRERLYGVKRYYYY